MDWLAAIWKDFATAYPMILTIEAGRYLAVAGLVSLVIAVFWHAGLKVRKIQTRSASAADLRREIATSLRTTLIFSATGFCMFPANKAGWLTIYQDFTVRGPVYFAVTLILMIIGQDTWFYWTHRAMHHPRLFRTFHWTHHKSKTPTPWTAYAFDMPEALVTVAFVPLSCRCTTWRSLASSPGRSSET